MNIRIKYLTAMAILIVAVVIAALGIGFNASAQNDQEQEEHLVIGLEPIEEGALESESTLLGRFDTYEEAEAFLNEGQGSNDQPSGHCVVHLEPLQTEETVSASTLIGCYDTFEEAISVATEGRVRLDGTVKPDQLTDEILNGSVGLEGTLASVVVGQDWDAPWFGDGDSITWTAPNRCDQGYEFGVASVSPYGWDNKISSARGYSGCDQFIHYENVNYGGTNIYCDQGSSSCDTMGYMSNKSSSLWWKD